MPENSTTPPYGSFGIFKATIEQLAEATVPSGPLDRRVLDQLSGADYGALISALKFFGYVDGERRATAKFRELIDVSDNQEQFRKFFLAALKDRYKPITGDLDVENGTAAELEKAFRDSGVPAGQMLTKTVRFFVKALQECGVAVSPHILKAKPRARLTPRINGAKIRRTKTPIDRTPPPPPHDHTTARVPQGMERMPIPGLPDAFIQYPANVTESQCDLFVQVIGVLRVYAQSREGKEKRA